MTPVQHKFFYFPAWNKCARACQWNTMAGIAGPGRTSEGTLDAELLARVRACAEQLARAEHRGLTPNDFRKGCHVVAIRRAKSSLELTNDEVTRVADLFRVLTSPLDVGPKGTIARWNDPTISQKENLIAAARHKGHNDSYLDAMARNKFQGRTVDELSVAQLRSLCFTLNQRAPGGARPAGRFSREEAKAAKEDPELQENPF